MQNGQGLSGKAIVALLESVHVQSLESVHVQSLESGNVQSLPLIWVMPQKDKLTHWKHLMIIRSAKILGWSENFGKFRY